MGQSPSQDPADLDVAFEAMKAGLACVQSSLNSTNVCAQIVRTHIEHYVHATQFSDKIRWINQGLEIIAEIKSLIAVMAPWGHPVITRFEECVNKDAAFPNAKTMLSLNRNVPSLHFIKGHDEATFGQKQKLIEIMQWLEQKSGLTVDEAVGYLRQVTGSAYPGTYFTVQVCETATYQEILDRLRSLLILFENYQDRYLGIIIFRIRHAAATVVDSQNKIIEMFDPNGFDFADYHKIDKAGRALEVLARERGYKIKKTSDPDMPRMSQRFNDQCTVPATRISMGGEKKGQCIHYAILYILLKFEYQWDMAKIINYMNEDQLTDAGYPSLIQRNIKGFYARTTRKRKYKKSTNNIKRRSTRSKTRAKLTSKR